MTRNNKNIFIEVLIFVDFVKKKKILTKSEIIDIWLVNIEDLHIRKVTSMSYRSKVILCLLHFIISVIMIVIYPLKKLVDKKSDKAEVHITRKTNEEYISLTYQCLISVDSYRFF